MAFPTTPKPSPESYFEPVQAVITARSLGGNLYTRDRHAGAQRGTFNLIYRALSQSQATTFFTDYWTDPGTFAFTWDFDASSHNVIYAGIPIRVHRPEGPDLFDLFVKLAKVP